MKVSKIYSQVRANGSVIYFVIIDGKRHYCPRDIDTKDARDSWRSRLRIEYETSGNKPAVKKDDPITINTLVSMYLPWAEDYYVKNGQQTEEYYHFERVAKRLCFLYGDMFVNDFEPLLLEEFRDYLMEVGKKIDGKPQKKRIEIIDGNPVEKPMTLEEFRVAKLKYDKTNRLSKPINVKYPVYTYINQSITRVRGIFQWGVQRKLVKSETYFDIKMLKGLKKGRSKASKQRKVKPVAYWIIEKTLLFLSSIVGAMVQLQWITGMRPEEVRVMRLCDIEQRDGVWLYTPWSYKMDYLDNPDDIPRLIALGPRAQEILKPFLEKRVDTPEKWLFSPQDAVAERKAKLREKRKSKVQPSQINRSKPNPKRPAKDHYDKFAYRRAIAVAAKKAEVPHWFPYQIRHATMCAIRAKEGLDVAQIVAGHKNAKTTEIYAEPDIAAAVAWAKENG